MAKKQPTYEEALHRLEQIVAEMENDTLDIDRLGNSLKEAQTLIKHCREILRQTDIQVKEILEEEKEG